MFEIAKDVFACIGVATVALLACAGVAALIGRGLKPGDVP
jgi:hypothetical protein